MRHPAPFLLTGLAALMMAGCSNAPIEGLPLATAQTAAADTVVKDTGLSGNKSIAITVNPPQEAGFRTLATVHKWQEADIYEYRVTLKGWNGSAFADFQTPLTVTIPRKGESPKTSAVFTHLRQGHKYQVTLVAMGNVGGTAAERALNSVPATGEFDFTATQDVEDSQSANLKVVFDAVPFSGSGTTTIEAPADSEFDNPTEPEAGAAQ